VVDDASLRTRLRSAGPARAAQFTWEACVDQHLEAYDRTARAGAVR
jgi:glycosyltransferase involved in cell wall biosynthesis